MAKVDDGWCDVARGGKKKPKSTLSNNLVVKKIALDAPRFSSMVWGPHPKKKSI